MAIKAFAIIPLLASITILCMNTFETLWSTEEYRKRIPPQKNTTLLENLEERHKEVQDTLSRETTRYMPEVKTNFLPTAYSITNLIQETGIDIRSYSVTNREGSPSLDLSATSSPTQTLSLFKELNNFPHYLDIRFFEAQKNGRTLKINLTLFPAITGNKEQDLYAIPPTPQNISPQRINTLFGIFPIVAAPPAPPAEPEKAPPREPTRQFIHIGEFITSSGEKVYAIKNTDNHQIKILSTGESKGNWILESVEKNLLILKVGENLFHIRRNNE